MADFFCGGGATAAVAQRLGRRWVACDQSRVAVAITADRIARLVEDEIGSLFAVPDFTVEHWGVYEAGRLSKTPPAQFRNFVLRAFGAVPEETDRINKIDKIEKEEKQDLVNPVNHVQIHGYKGAVPDHPKLEHGWLWDIFGSKIRPNVMIDDVFDETEDLPEPPPKQELTQPENVIDVPEPDPNLVDDGEFDLGEFDPPPEPLEKWREALAALTYDPTVVEITKVKIGSVIGKELADEQWTTIKSAPEMLGDAPPETVEFPDDTLRDAIKESVLQMAEEMAVAAGYAAGFKSEVYSALIRHIREKFLDGASLGLVERAELTFAWKMLPQVKKNVSAVPGLIEGIIEYGD